MRRLARGALWAVALFFAMFAGNVIEHRGVSERGMVAALMLCVSVGCLMMARDL